MLKEKTHALTVGTKYQKIKQHVKDNQVAYISGVGGVTVGALGVLLLTRSPMQFTNNVAPVIAPVFNNDNSSVVNLGGPMTKMVKCLETGEIWEKVTYAAEDAGVTLHKMSQHLNGHKDHVNDLHYKIIGLGTAD